jgi:dienelactone hydrolase
MREKWDHGLMRTVQFLFLLALPVLAVDDPFVPFLTSIPPITQTLSQVNSGSGPAAITTKKFTFSSRNTVNTVYGVLVYPQAAGTYPGILVLHGGGSNAEGVAGVAAGFAQRGYVALAIDLPGIAGTTNTPNTLGPWKSRPLGEAPRFDVSGGPQTSMLVDAEVAGLEAFNLLRSQTNVKAESMGITGYSWGGYSTTFLTGLLGDKVKAAYAVFGCGFYDKGSSWKALIAAMPAADRDVWLKYIDAGRRAPDIKAAYFLEGETNDTYFWPEAVGATLDAITAPNKNHTWGPNLNHNQMPAGPTMQRLHFDHYLKGLGSAFATVEVKTIAAQPDGGKKIGFEVKLPANVVVDSARLFYSEVKPDWQTRVWLSLVAIPEASNPEAGSVSNYSATLPAAEAAKQINYYAYVTDTRTAATASAMYNSASTTGLTPAIGTSIHPDRAGGFVLDAQGVMGFPGRAIDVRGAIIPAP